MMKKRILASSMASVMALSSASVVAFADEAKKDYGEAVTKDELQAYVDSFESFVDDELDEYGNIQGEDFTEALDRANAVLEDSKAKATDYTAAYQMLKAVRNSLRVYTNAELKALVNEHKGAYNSENILNKTIQDKIYGEDEYSDFVDAYVDAEDAIEDDDARTVTDAYMSLKRTAEKLAKLDTVKKSEFRAALREYEALEAKMADYEPWRRGTATVNPKSGNSEVKIADLKGQLTFEDLCYIVYTDDKSQDSVGSRDAKSIKGNYCIGKNVARTGTLKEAVTEIYKSLDETVGAVETSDEKYINAYDAIKEAVNVFNSWTPDDVDNCSSDSKADKIEEKYHNRLVRDFNDDQIQAIITLMNTEEFASKKDGDDTVPKYEVEQNKNGDEVKANDDFSIIVDKNTGYLICGITTETAELKEAIFPTKEAAQAKCDTTKGQQVKNLTRNSNLLEYLDYVIDAAAITETTDTAGLQEELGNAIDALADLGGAPANAVVDGDKEAVTVESTDYNYYKVDTATVESDVETNYDPAIEWTTKKGEVDAAIANIVAANTILEVDNDGEVYIDYAGNTYAAYKEIDGEDDTGDLLGAYATVLGEFKTLDATEVTGLATAKSEAVAAAEEAVEEYNGKVDDIKAAAKKLAETESKNESSAEEAEAKAEAIKVALYVYEEYKALQFTTESSDDDTETAKKFMETKFEVDENTYEGLTVGGPKLQKYNGGSNEWKIVGRFLAYALDDFYPVATKTDKTKEKLMSLIEDSYTITDLTGDSAAFSSGEYHIKVVKAREVAYEFYKLAKAEGKNINYDEFKVGEKDIDDVYSDLKKAKENLEKALAEFEYSYEEIRDAIGEYATKVDAGEVKSDALVTAINKCAYDLSVLEASEFVKDQEVVNYAFDEDGEFQFANRLKTKKNKIIAYVDPNKLEKNLKDSFEAMQKAYTDATAPAAGVKYDFDGDGKIGTSDLLVALNAVAGASTDTKFDANGDGKVSTSDLLVMLGEFAAQA